MYVCFGAGDYFRDLKDYLDYEISFVVDNQENKWGDTISGCAIKSPDWLKENKDIVEKIIITSMFQRDIFNQLTNTMDFEESKIIIPDKSTVPPLFLDEKVRQQALEIVFFIAELISNYRFSIWADFGTLLGLVRDGDLIPWDDDIDFSCANPDHFKKFIEILSGGESLCIGGQRWIIDGSINADQLGPVNFSCDFTLVDENCYKTTRIHLDLKLYREIDNCLVSPPHMSIFKPIPIGVASPIKNHSCGDRMIPVPSKTSEYLAVVYGRDWRTPKQNWNYLGYWEEI